MDGLEVMAPAEVVDDMGKGGVIGSEATVADEPAEEVNGGATRRGGDVEDLEEERGVEADVGEVKGEVAWEVKGG
ncbi:hypothetical protein IEQ34_004058 [Dendrobium chrysotoxum]|uniref:Uncharacterized protein n=1 Tax=Dendrobium chrysotoxum TaxID=161865 RepID=A0AAV7HHC6_DENCH|nr:hypothetical protein IEQ34_004058 [Dendrobium chrysotoxum]